MSTDGRASQIVDLPLSHLSKIGTLLPVNHRGIFTFKQRNNENLSQQRNRCHISVEQQKVKRGILERSPDYEPHLMAANAGIILHSMISGWDKRECTKVYSLLCQWNNISSTVF